MKKNLLFGILMLLSLGVLAQETITGTVNDDTGQPVPGASVFIKGTSTRTVSDADGKFSITAGKAFPFTLSISSLGLKTEEIEIYELPDASIELSLKNDLLNEVIVTGYVTTERKDLIGSISKINPSDIKTIPTGSFDAQLQGKVAGLQISTSTGVPGEATTVRLRGATSINADNSPLYVVDGVFINTTSLQTVSTGGHATSPIADINPADIESIEVLKDAEATALYGSRGANGVIIVSTKRGSFDQKPLISFNASAGATKAAKLWDLTTGPEHATLVNEYYTNIGGVAPFTGTSLNPGASTGRGTPELQKTFDRQGEAFRTAQLRSYDLSVSGGTKTTKYYIGGGYNKQESILRPMTFDRASLKINLDQKITDKVQIGFTNAFTRSFRNQGRAGDGPAGGILQSALHTPTYLPPFDEAGNPLTWAGFDNLTLLLDNYDVNSTSLRYIGNFYLDAELLPGLTFKTSFSTDYNIYNESEHWKSFLISGAPNGTATATNSQSTTLLNEQTLNYRKSIGDHTFGFLLGNTLQSNTSNSTGSSGVGFANNAFSLVSSASTTTGSQSWSKANLASFFGRVNYSFRDKYLVDASLRADGSSKFGSDNRWGYFPGVGAAWRIKRESFLSDVQAITDMKLKASYGITGNQNGIGNFASQGLWTGGASYQGVAGTAPQQLGNPGLSWESTTQFNLGVDLTLFKGRISLEGNYYSKYTTDGLLSKALAATSGFSSVSANAVEISNKGFEFGINTVNIKNGAFRWTTDFNISRNVNKIEKLANRQTYGSRDLQLMQEGSPMYSFWVYKQLYVDPQTGNVVYEDVDGVPGITAADRQVYGSVWPKFYGGITNTLSYKSFDASVFFAYQYGNKVYNHNAFFGGSVGARDGARIEFAENLKRWQKPGDITDVPKADGINVNNYKDGGSRWLEDGSFLRLRSLTLGYTLPKTLTQKFKVKTLRIYMVGSNLFLITKYTGLDPESASNSSQNQQGIDLGTPPQSPGFQVGINVTL
jgi:TonB-linked SusC/RagA family outer membrane protein